MAKTTINGDLMGCNGTQPLVMTNIAIENGNLQLIYPLNMVVFLSYVSLPEGMQGYALQIASLIWTIINHWNLAASDKSDKPFQKTHGDTPW